MKRKLSFMYSRKQVKLKSAILLLPSQTACMSQSKDANPTLNDGTHICSTLLTCALRGLKPSTVREQEWESVSPWVHSPDKESYSQRVSREVPVRLSSQ